MAVENPVDDHAELVLFKIDAIIADAKPVENAPGAFQLAELLQLGGHDLLWQAAEFAEDLQLQFLGHLCQFRRTGRIKNDLK